jgi:hypothetical protein
MASIDEKTKIRTLILLSFNVLNLNGKQSRSLNVEIFSTKTAQLLKYA